MFYNAWFVTNSLWQDQSTNYDEIVSSYQYLKSVRVKLAITEYFNYEMKQMDVEMIPMRWK